MDKDQEIYITQLHRIQELEKQLYQTRRWLKRAADYLCSDYPEQGDYCRCGAYVGDDEVHKKNCEYIKIIRFLNKK